MRICVRLLSLALVLLLFSSDAAGHTRSQSVSQWIIAASSAHVVLRVPLIELTRIPDARPLEVWLGAYAAARLILRADGKPCSVIGSAEVLRPAADRVGVAWTVRCGPGARTIESRFLLDVAPAHLHFARIRRAGGTAERILSASAPHWTLEDTEREASGAGVARYVWLGLAHITTGFDHLAFLLALLLVGRSGREVVVVVSGFTIGHSLTLAIAALGVLQPNAPAVEALIGLSIALVACEGVVTGASVRAWTVAWTAALVLLAGARSLGLGAVPVISLLGLALFVACYLPLLTTATRPERVRAAVALLFGLVHGLGFGGFLLELGLPPTRVATALFGFNVGVEIGQLILVALTWPLVRVLRHGIFRESGLSAVTALGLYWFVTRAYG